MVQKRSLVFAQILIRNIEENVKRRLKQRAKVNGHSMEEEARTILREAVKPVPKEGLGTELAKLFSDVPKEFKILKMRGRVRIPKFDD